MSASVSLKKANETIQNFTGDTFDFFQTAHDFMVEVFSYNATFKHTLLNNKNPEQNNL